MYLNLIEKSIVTNLNNCSEILADKKIKHVTEETIPKF